MMIRKIILLILLGMLIFGCTGAKKKNNDVSFETRDEFINDSKNTTEDIVNGSFEINLPVEETKRLPPLLKDQYKTANAPTSIEISRLWNVHEGDRDDTGLARWQYITNIRMVGTLVDSMPTEHERRQGIIWKYQLVDPIVTYDLNNTYSFEWKPKDIYNWCRTDEETVVPEGRAIAYSRVAPSNAPIMISIYDDYSMRSVLSFRFDAAYRFQSNCNPEIAGGTEREIRESVLIDVPLESEYVRDEIIQGGTSRLYTYGKAIRSIDEPTNGSIYSNEAEVHHAPEQNPSWVVTWRMITPQ